MKTRTTILGVVALLVFAGWSAFWWFAASTVESASADAIAKAGRRGITVDCANKNVRGWPFQMTLVCDRAAVKNARFHVEANGLRAVALVYNPSHLIVEADAPFVFTDANLPAPIAADWKAGRASVELSGGLVERASIEFKEISGQSASFLPLSRPSADSLEVHVRRAAGPADLDIAITSESIKADLADSALPPFDLKIVATLVEGAPLLVGRREQFIERVKTGAAALDISRALVSIGAARVEFSGRFFLNPEGYLTGNPRIAIANAPALATELARIPGIDASKLKPILQLIANFGEKTTIDDAPAGGVTLSIRDGYMSAGFLRFGRLSPVIVN